MAPGLVLVVEEGSVTSKAPRWRPDAIFRVKIFPSRLVFFSDAQCVHLDNRGMKSHLHQRQTFGTVLKFLRGAVFTAPGTVYMTLDITIGNGYKNVTVKYVKQVATISLRVCLPSA